MTAQVLLDQKIDFNKEVTITEEEINYPQTLADGGATSEVSLRAGDIVKVSDLWVAMLTASSNQSAIILADNSGLTRVKFVQAMNKKAKSLGLVKTKFYEMTGLDPRNVSTPREMALIAQRAFSIAKIADNTQKNHVFMASSVDGTAHQVSVLDRNYSLLAMDCDASKTGYLVEAQNNVALKKGNAVVVVLHAASNAQRNKIISKLLPK